MRDGNSDRTVKYEGKLVGDELHMSACRRPEDKPTAADISVRWADIGFKNSVESARDLFEHKDLPMSGTEYKATVPSHGVVFLRVGK